jgi:probable F420-dependent oxidoreductase
MDIGCHLPTQGPLATREALTRFCREAEARNIASLWVSDHVVFPRTKSGEYPGGRFPHAPDTAYLEPVAVLAAAAMVTERARLGSSVFILGHRHPVVMAKLLTTIDALSNGRLIVGVGVGWWEEELTILGVPYKQRGRHADEILKIFKTLWTSDHPTFEGEFFRFDDVGFQPKPVQKPYPPIWVGGNSPGAFRRVVEHGDGWHATFLSPEQLRAGLDQLRAAADAAKRSFDTIEVSMRVGTKGPIPDSRQSLVDLLGAYKRAGLTHVVLDIRRDSLAEMLEALDAVATDIRPAVDRG